MVQKANLDDGKSVINLLALAMESALFAFGSSDEKIAKTIFCELFKKDDTKFSHNNIFVKKLDGKVVGAICFCRTDKEDELLKIGEKYINALGFTSSLKVEGCGKSLYIDSLAVDEEYRHKGIAKELIDEVCNEAKRFSLSEVSLLVSLQKPITQSYYEKLGFKCESELWLYGEKYRYMIKTV
ncbi:GNAT family N-acetyltransferase [Campylobacter geochelonis]|uniref:GNAT family N-acetyltransferase n=1 Tax=Campylobacter geochelonis TaxID=1780362 RepID=UPI000770B5D8|nr:GNAT family N-acetyltransferase [Campylobacter geochelonis]CZE48234.1 acetyltransferase [Campylobacter geochelonis]